MVPISATVILSLASALFSAGGFWYLMNYRVTRLEENDKVIIEIRERLARIEAILNQKKMLHE